jgi:membrane-anchored protein YejM (alkaline phosphatase superfamily)
MEWIAKTSSRPRARFTGVVYLLSFLTAILAEVLGRRNVVYGDAANLVADALYIAVTVLFYFMFKPVNRNLSLLAACRSLAGCAIMILASFISFRPA